MRLLVARCQVDYAGRLTAHLPMATRVVMVKGDSQKRSRMTELLNSLGRDEKCLKEGEPVPEIFKDPAFSYSSSWYISSSQLSSEYFNGYGWSQVIDDGWGTC